MADRINQFSGLLDSPPKERPGAGAIEMKKGSARHRYGKGGSTSSDSEKHWTELEQKYKMKE